MSAGEMRHVSTFGKLEQPKAENIVNMKKSEVPQSANPRKRLSANSSGQSQLQFHSNNQGVQQMMQNTLNSQNNCFLPNYKKNHMMKRYEDQYSQYIESNNKTKTRQFSPSEMYSKGKNIKKKPKNVKLAIDNKEGRVIQLTAAQKQKRFLNNSSADLEPILQPTPYLEGKIIKIQTASALQNDNKHRDNNSAQIKKTPDQIESPNFIGNPISLKQQLRDKPQTASQPTRTVIASTSGLQFLNSQNQQHQRERNYSPDYNPQTTTFHSNQVNNNLALCTEDTINNSSSQHNYIQQQRLDNSQLLNEDDHSQLVQDDQGMGSIGIATPNIFPENISAQQRNASALDNENRPLIMIEQDDSGSPIHLRGGQSVDLSPSRRKQPSVEKKSPKHHQSKERQVWQPLNVGLFKMNITQNEISGSRPQSPNTFSPVSSSHNKHNKSKQNSRSMSRPQSGESSHHRNPQKTNLTDQLLPQTEYIQEQISLEQQSQNPLSSSVEQLMYKQSLGHDYISKTSQRESTPFVQPNYRQIYGEDVPLQQATLVDSETPHGTKNILNVQLQSLNAQNDGGSPKKTIFKKQNESNQKSQFSKPAPLDSQRSNTNMPDNQKQELISFGISVLNKDSLTIKNLKIKTSNHTLSKTQKKRKPSAKKKSKQRMKEGKTRGGSASEVALRHQRNDSAVIGILGSQEQKLGFDSGGTNESKQKLDFFENRYAPDDEIEIGAPDKIQSPKKFNLSEKRSSQNQLTVASGFTPIQGHIYTRIFGEDGQQYIMPMAEQQQAYDSNLVEPQPQQRRQVVTKTFPSKTDVLDSNETETVPVISNQQQVTLHDFGSDFYGLSGFAQSQSYQIETGRSDVYAAYYPVTNQENGQLMFVPVTLFKLDPNINYSPEQQQPVTHQPLSQKTLQQCIAAKRDEQIFRLSKNGSLYPQLQLRKQEDEARFREIAEQTQKRIKERQMLNIQGTNIKTIGQKMIEAIAQSQMVKFTNMIGNPDNQINHQGLEHAQEPPIFTGTTLQGNDPSLIAGPDSNSNSERHRINSIPNTFLSNRYDKSLPALVGTLATDNSQQQLIKSITQHQDGGNGSNKYIKFSDDETLHNGSSSSLQQKAINTSIAHLNQDLPLQNKMLDNTHLQLQIKAKEWGFAPSPPPPVYTKQVLKLSQLAQKRGSKDGTPLLSEKQLILLYDQFSARALQDRGPLSQVEEEFNQTLTLNEALKQPSSPGANLRTFSEKNSFTQEHALSSKPMTIEKISLTAAGNGQLKNSARNDFKDEEIINTIQETEIIIDESPKIQQTKEEFPEKQEIKKELCSRSNSISKRQTAPVQQQQHNERNEKDALSKSYSKMMKSIGEDLKNVGPFSRKSLQSAQKKSQQKLQSAPELFQGQVTSNEDFNSNHDIFSNTGTSLAGVTALIGGPSLRQAPGTATGGRRYASRPLSPFLHNPAAITATVMPTMPQSRQRSPVTQTHAFNSSSLNSRPMMLKNESSSSFVKLVRKSDNQNATFDVIKHAGNETQKTKQNEYEMKQNCKIQSSYSRTNIIVENIKMQGNNHRIFLGSNSSISRRMQGPISNSNLNEMAKTGFSKSYRQSTGHHSRKTQSMQTFNAQSNHSLGLIPQQMAGLECMQNTQGIKDNDQEIVKTTLYNGVFSANNFEMVVPEKDQVVRIANMKQSTATPLQRHRLLKNNDAYKTHASQRVSPIRTAIPLPHRRNLSNQVNLTQYQRQSMNAFGTNKLKVFQKLKKGTVFKDEDFEAKKPDPKSGVKIYSLY